MLSLGLNIDRCCAGISTLLYLNWQRLDDVTQYPLALYLLKYLVFVDSSKTGIFRHCEPQLIKEL